MNWLQSLIELFTRWSVTTIAAWAALAQTVREAVPIVKAAVDSSTLPPIDSMSGLGLWLFVLAGLLAWVWLSGDARLKLAATLYGRWRRAVGAPMIDLGQTDPVAFYSSLRNVVSVRWSGWAKPVSVRVKGTAGVATVGLQTQFLEDLSALTGGKGKYVCSFKNLGRGWLEAKAVGKFTSKMEASMLRTLEELELIAVVRPGVFDRSTIIDVVEETEPVESITWTVGDGSMLAPVEKQALAEALMEARGGDWLVSSAPDGKVKASRVQAAGPRVMDVAGDGSFAYSEAKPDWVREQEARVHAGAQQAYSPYDRRQSERSASGAAYDASSAGGQRQRDGQGSFRGGKPEGMSYVNL